MVEPLRVADDRPCRCGYNLRGLAFAGRCPECGRPVSERVRFTIRDAPKDAAEEQAVRNRKAAFRRAAQGSPYPVEAFALVHRSVGLVRLQSARRSVPAGDVCDAFREYARCNLGGPARATLKLAKWNIRRSEDVGAIVFRLVDVNVLQAEPGDSPEQFARRFTLETLYAGEIDNPAAVAAALAEASLPTPGVLEWLWRRVHTALSWRRHRAPPREE